MEKDKRSHRENVHVCFSKRSENPVSGQRERFPPYSSAIDFGRMYVQDFTRTFLQRYALWFGGGNHFPLKNENRI